MLKNRLSASPIRLTKSKYCKTSTKTAKAAVKMGRYLIFLGIKTRKKAQITATTSISPI